MIYTSTLYSYQLFLVPLGHSNFVYLPLNFTITLEDTSKIIGRINTAPHFKYGIENLYVVIDRYNYTLKYQI